MERLDFSEQDILIRPRVQKIILMIEPEILIAYGGISKKYNKGDRKEVCNKLYCTF